MVVGRGIYKQKEKVMKGRILITAALMATLMLPFGVLPAYANSAQTYFHGTDAAGLIMKEDSPIVVESELLMFDIGSFPSEYITSEEEFKEFHSSVTAQYSFYNPSQYTVTAGLMFPFGSKPSYVEGYYDEDYNFIPFDDIHLYDITADGEVVKRTVRHTYIDGDFNLENALEYFSDSYVQDEFYFPELTVTKYTFNVKDVDENKYRASRIAWDVAAGRGDYRIYLPSQTGGQVTKDGDYRISAAMSNEPFDLYVFGESLDVLPDWKLYKDGGCEDGEEITGSVTLADMQSTTFEEYALSERDENSTVSDIDWYNAYVAMSNSNMQSMGQYPLTFHPMNVFNFERNLMRWYEYELTFTPGQHLVNTVTAPMYPAINKDYSPTVYEYTYLLSPAKTWSEFGKLQIVISPYYYMTACNLDGFELGKDGYMLTLNGLPEGELAFTLSTSEAPMKKIYNPLTDPVNLTIIVAICLTVVVIAGGITVIVFIRRKKRGNR